MHFYSLAPAAVNALRLRTFWLMSECVDRIMAQADMRSLTVTVAGMDGESASEYRKSLVIESGTLVKMEVVHERDEDGVAFLKGIANGN